MLDGPAFRHFYIYVHGHWHGHATWTWICSMEMDMYTQQGFGDTAWIWTMDMHGCRNADKEFSPASLVFVSLQRLVRHRHSGIVVSPVPLGTDKSVNAQLCLNIIYWHNFLLLLWISSAQLRSIRTIRIKTKTTVSKLGFYLNLEIPMFTDNKIIFCIPDRPLRSDYIRLFTLTF